MKKVRDLTRRGFERGGIWAAGARFVKSIIEMIHSLIATFSWACLAVVFYFFGGLDGAEQTFEIAPYGTVTIGSFTAATALLLAWLYYARKHYNEHLHCDYPG